MTVPFYLFFAVNYGKTKGPQSLLKRPTFCLTLLSRITCGITLHAGLKNAAGRHKCIVLSKKLPLHFAFLFNTTPAVQMIYYTPSMFGPLGK